MSPANVACLSLAHPYLFDFMQSLDRRVDCGDGWLQIIKRMCERMESTLRKQGVVPFNYPTLAIEANAHGDLIVCPSWSNPALMAIIAEAYAEACHTCMDCGQPGRVEEIHLRTWVLCSRCARSHRGTERVEHGCQLNQSCGSQTVHLGPVEKGNEPTN